jgi:uncharacterized protein (TIGR02466 family)
MAPNPTTTRTTDYHSTSFTIPMGTLTYLFAPFYWKTHIAETPEILNLYLAKINENVQKFPSLKPQDWDCDVHTNFNAPKMQLDPGVLGAIYRKYLQDFWVEGKFGLANMHIQQPWYNSYAQNQFQEFHGHLPNDFSAVHYIVFDEKEHQATTFINPNPTLSQALQVYRAPLLTKCLPGAPEHSCYQTSFTPQDVRQGDLIIFPSYLNHYVKPNMSTKKRVTISFNLQIS